MKASILIPTYQRELPLLDTLRCCLDQKYECYEIIIVDQTGYGSTSFKDVINKNDNIKYYYHPVASLPAARNECIKRSNGDILIFIDDDVLFESEFVAAHMSEYMDKKVFAVAGGVLEGESITKICKPPEKSYFLGRATLIFNSSVPGIVRGARGCNVSFRREVFTIVGMFDENLPAPFLREDNDIYLRMNRLKLAIKFSPNASLIHLKAPAGGTAELKKDFSDRAERHPWLKVEPYMCETIFQLKNFNYVLFPLFIVYFFVGWVLVKNKGNVKDSFRSFISMIKGVRLGVRYYNERYK